MLNRVVLLPYLYQFVQSLKIMKFWKPIKRYLRSLYNPQLMPTAFKVALFVGSLLFTINHGWALLHGQMTSERWTAASLTYIVPYLVNIHGQHIGRACQ